LSVIQKSVIYLTDITKIEFETSTLEFETEKLVMITDSACPQCKSKAFKRNGYTRHGKQNHRCLECGRQFSLDIPQTAKVKEAELIAFSLMEAAVPDDLVATY
jgi:transposase-like protein